MSKKSNLQKSHYKHAHPLVPLEECGVLKIGEQPKTNLEAVRMQLTMAGCSVSLPPPVTIYIENPRVDKEGSEDSVSISDYPEGSIGNSVLHQPSQMSKARSEGRLV